MLMRVFSAALHLCSVLSGCSVSLQLATTPTELQLINSVQGKKSLTYVGSCSLPEAALKITTTLQGNPLTDVAVLGAQDYWLSLDRYINWSSTAKSTNDFYTDWSCRQMYKDHIGHYVNRRNTYNGRLYKEDPTIFYWDLINEPRW